MTMHPYRDPSPPQGPEDLPAREPGLRLAFGVMTFVAAVQVAASIPHYGPLSLQTVFGGACFIAGVVWLLRHCHR
jgi:hypothetical protein